MIFTLFYMYATFIQWWKLGVLKNKLNGTLNAQNALLVCDHSVVFDSKKLRSFENLLFRNGDRIGCTVVPKQKLSLNQWVSFPKKSQFFPIYFKPVQRKIQSPCIYVLVQAAFETYNKHQSALIEVENFGELVAWKLSDYFEAILKTDIDKLTKLVHCFSQNDLDINHDLKLLKVETVNIEGNPSRIKYERTYSTETQLNYSYAPIHWRKFTEEIKLIYSSLQNTTNPKITIENGSAKSEDAKKVPVSEVKPIKKESKKEDRNTLEVAARRHRSKDKEKLKVRKDEVDVSRSKSPVSSSKKEEEEIVNKKSTQVVVKSDSGSSEAKKTDKKSNGDRADRRKGFLEKAKAKLERSDHKKGVKCQKTDDLKKDDIKEEKVAQNENNVKVENASCSEANGSVTKPKSSPGKASKPPNILVYADSFIAKENVKVVLQEMLNRDKYTIYDFPTTSLSAWNSSTVLVVVCGSVPPNLASSLLGYLLNGGQLLCLCSDLLNSVVQTFTTAEVREHELVRFSYKNWKQVKMMHHIFCYQASPAKKQFSKDSDHSSGNGSSPVAPRMPSSVDIHHNGKDYVMHVQVLGAEETWQTPSLLLATVRGSEGRAVFSQVHLEINPTQYEEDEDKYSALKGSDKARLEILKDLLTSHLDIDCSSFAGAQYTPAYFLGRYDLKLKMVADSDSIKNYKLSTDKLLVTFHGKNSKFDQATVDTLPVLIHACPANFSTVKYFEALDTKEIGRLVIYSDVLGSTQDVISKPLSNGLVVIARQQTKGVGRSSNAWISPPGCAMFSLQLHLNLDSALGKAVPLIQHLVMVGICSAIRSIKGAEDLDIGIKWPNDLYARGSVKIGGLIAKSFVLNKSVVVNVGVGVNLDNSDPTTCINDLLRECNEQKRACLPPIGYEEYFALVFNEIERILTVVQEDNMQHLYDLYYKYWLHSDARITIRSKSGEEVKVQIVDIDEYGFLRVRSEEGHFSSVQPDGNTFDMMKGLIAPKLF